MHEDDTDGMTRDLKKKEIIGNTNLIGKDGNAEKCYYKEEEFQRSVHGGCSTISTKNEG
jgi:hypothetical protein